MKNNKIDEVNKVNEVNKILEVVNHPEYYNLYSIEAIDMAIKIWGKEKVKDCAEITAFFYRMRLGLKDDIDNDLEKEKWWLDKYKELNNTKSSKTVEKYQNLNTSSIPINNPNINPNI